MMKYIYYLTTFAFLGLISCASGPTNLVSKTLSDEISSPILSTDKAAIVFDVKSRKYFYAGRFKNIETGEFVVVQDSPKSAGVGLVDPGLYEMVSYSYTYNDMWTDNSQNPPVLRTGPARTVNKDMSGVFKPVKIGSGELVYIGTIDSVTEKKIYREGKSKSHLTRVLSPFSNPNEVSIRRYHTIDRSEKVKAQLEQKNGKLGERFTTRLLESVDYEGQATIKITKARQRDRLSESSRRLKLAEKSHKKFLSDNGGLEQIQSAGSPDIQHEFAKLQAVYMLSYHRYLTHYTDLHGEANLNPETLAAKKQLDSVLKVKSSSDEDISKSYDLIGRDNDIGALISVTGFIAKEGFGALWNKLPFSGDRSSEDNP